MADDNKDNKKEEKESTKKASKKVDALVEDVSKLTVLELSELVAALQEKLGVSATVPVSAPSAVSASDSAPSGQPAGEATAAATQTVIMTAAGDKKIDVIRAIREINQTLGLKEAKDMTEQVPAEILKDAKAEDAKAAADKLKAAGATVELK